MLSINTITIAKRILSLSVFEGGERGKEGKRRKKVRKRERDEK